MYPIAMAPDNMPVTVNRQGGFHVPAAAQEAEPLCYNHEAKVTLEVSAAFMDSVTFTAYVTSSSNLTIPSEIRTLLNIEPGDVVRVDIQGTGEKWTPDTEGTFGRVDYTAADTTDDRTKTHQSPDDDEEDDDQPQGLGKIFSDD